MAEFAGKVALVTGAAAGIGRATAEHYARKGAKVVVSDIDAQKGDETVSAIQSAGGDAFFVEADVSSPEDCEQLVRQTLDHYGRLDYACNNAGIGGASHVTGEYPLDEWQKVIDINLNGVFYCMRYQIPAMLKNGGGAIVNMASILGSVGFAQAPAYVAAKHGVVGLTKAAAIEYAQHGIRINAIGPAFIRTALTSELEADEDTHQMLISRHPMGRLGEPEEVAAMAVWLSSEQSSFVTGGYHEVDGGYLAR